MAIAPIFNCESGAPIRAELNEAFVSLSSRAALQQKPVHAGISAARLDGYMAAGDGVDALYVCASGEPRHPGKIRSLDQFLPNGAEDPANGGCWELREPVITPEMLGARGDADEDGNGSDDSIAIQAVIDCAKTGNGRVELGAKRYGIYRTINIDGDNRVSSPSYSGISDPRSECFCWGVILEDPKDNVNVTNATGLEGRSVYGDLVYVGRKPDSGANYDTNGMAIQVQAAVRFSGFAINYDVAWHRPFGATSQGNHPAGIEHRSILSTERQHWLFRPPWGSVRQ
jgi:hypothetical protein